MLTNVKPRRNVKSFLQKNTPRFSVLYSNFSLPELNEALCLLKRGKRPGPNNIHADFLNNIGPIAHLALAILHRSWHSGVPSTLLKKPLLFLY
ncbi:hypothetical protein TNIN_454491 [Trichonephila inaurata madagascariensis]|uniref:Uncharacterized protein n=1 Tax=Trichonephila inaurata madagascariensis TaxID=2747483 RepID=A0A8X6JAA9_9ARAC|nr:hypothetical protein TNIN_454491 [Trichonephila inaurata madagascariensis]